MDAGKYLSIRLSQTLYAELVRAAAECGETDDDGGCTPAEFAKQCVEVVLAERRLDRTILGGIGSA